MEAAEALEFIVVGLIMFALGYGVALRRNRWIRR